LPIPEAPTVAATVSGWSQAKENYFGAYAFGNPDNVGKYFYLDMVDPSGSVIARASVTITG